MRVKNRRELASLRFLWYNGCINYLMEVGMIKFKQTGEIFSDIFAAKEALLSFAEKTDHKRRQKAELVFDAGEYILEKPIVFDAKTNPSLANVEISFMCENGKSLFTSEYTLDKNKLKKSGNYYIYQFEADENGNFPRVRDFYVDGKRIPMCRSEKFIHAFAFARNKERLCEENLEGIYIPKEAAQALPEGDLGALEVLIHMEWEFYILHPVAIDMAREKYDENGNRHVLMKMDEREYPDYVDGVNRCLQPKNRAFFFMNHPAFLSEDTFCYDHHTGVLCYCPGAELGDKLTVPRLNTLLFLKGVSEITLENLAFRGISDQFVCDNGYLSHQANIEKRVMKKIEDAAVYAQNTGGFTVKNCEFRDMNTNGILMVGDCARVCIEGCRFENIGMSAISIGDPIRVGQHPRICSYDVRVENNFLRRIGFDFPSAPAIDIFRVDGLSICHNTIEYCAYSGISAGWEWGLQPYALGEMINIRDAEIAYNRILHHMQILNDGGAIYMVGSNSRKEYRRYFNFMHDNFAFRDEPRRTVRGYYLDGSSTNWHIWDNVTSGTQRPVFSQFVVPEQYTWNNLLDDTYTTDEVHAENHAPERNTILGDVFFAPTLEELYEKYPKAKAIFENSGCRLS